MNALQQLVIVSALLGSAVALAQEGTQTFRDIEGLSTRSRAEVVAELTAARAQGLLDQRGQAYGGFEARSIASTKSRAEVVAELNAARAAGELTERGQSYGSFNTRAIASTRTRAEVIAELREARSASRGLSQRDRS